MDFYSFDRMLRAIAAAEVEAALNCEKKECECCKVKNEKSEGLRMRFKDQPAPPIEKEKPIGCKVCDGGGFVKGSKVFKMIYSNNEVRLQPIEVKFCPNCGKEIG